MRIEKLMTKSSTTCRPDDTLSEAAQTMLHNDCRCLPVTASDGSRRLAGMITDHDICRATRFGWGTLEQLRVRHAMLKNIRPCHPGDTLAEAKAAMLEARVLHLPVVDESEQVIGLVSRADLVGEAAWVHGSHQRRPIEAKIDEELAIVSEPRDIGERSHDYRATGERPIGRIMSGVMTRSAHT